MNRRNLVHGIIGSGALVCLPSILKASGSGKGGNARIDKIELFRYDSNVPRYFSWGTWLNRQQVFMKISSGTHYGWAETKGSANNPDLDLSEWGSFLQKLSGMDVYQAYEHVKTNQKDKKDEGLYEWKKLEFMEMALLDLIGKIEGRPATDLLGLKSLGTVPGLFCVLDKDIEKVKERIREAQRQGFDTHVKFKMYGEEPVDLEIAMVARSMLGPDSFIMSDVNGGYKDWTDLDELAGILKNLHQAGLDAVEDPAELDVSQWKALQSLTGDLALIPDTPVRPAWKGKNIIEKGMGRFYNIHPDCMGSLNLLPALGRKIRSFDAGIMVGDASLVGPACNAWQQIAIGLGASWVEAIEKVPDSEAYLECVVSKPTFRESGGKIAFNPQAGFGLELNEDNLRSISTRHVEIA